MKNLSDKILTKQRKIEGKGETGEIGEGEGEQVYGGIVEEAGNKV